MAPDPQPGLTDHLQTASGLSRPIKLWVLNWCGLQDAEIKYSQHLKSLKSGALQPF